MKQTIAVLGFEPALQTSLETLLSREPDLTLASPSETAVDTLIIFPPNVEWVQQLHTRFPKARLLAMVDWHRRHHFAGAPIDDFIDNVLSYRGLLEQVRSGRQGKSA